MLGLELLVTDRLTSSSWIILIILQSWFANLSFFSSEDCSYDPIFSYQAIVGCLQFACIGTHLNFSYVVSVAAKYCVNYSPAYCNALRQILKYLAWTM